jgi:hypothetical protein
VPGVWNAALILSGGQRRKTRGLELGEARLWSLANWPALDLVQG